MSDFPDVFAHFNNPTHNLNRQEAVAYVAWALLHLAQTECYPTGLMELLPQHYPGMELSDTILFATLKRLEDKDLVSYTRTPREPTQRGRPRKLYKINPRQREAIKRLGDLWVTAHGTAEAQRA